MVVNVRWIVTQLLKSNTGSLARTNSIMTEQAISHGHMMALAVTSSPTAYHIRTKYRLPHPHEVKTAGIDVQRDAVKSNDAQLEADLNDCIGQPQEDIKTIRAEMLAVLNDTRLTMNLRAAMKLVDAFIDAGYRKQ